MNSNQKQKKWGRIRYCELENNSIEVRINPEEEPITDLEWFEFLDQVVKYPYQDNHENVGFELSNNFFIIEESKEGKNINIGLHALRFNENAASHDKAGYHDLLPQMIMNLDAIPQGFKRAVLVVDALSKLPIVDEKTNSKTVKSSVEDNTLRFLGYAASDFSKVLALGFNHLSRRATKGLADFMKSLVGKKDVDEELAGKEEERTVAENLVHLLFGYSGLKLIAPSNLISSMTNSLLRLMKERIYRYTAHGDDVSGISSILKKIRMEKEK